MEPTRMLRCATHRASIPMAMGLAVLALAGAHTAAASAAESSHPGLPAPWHSTTRAGSVHRVAHPGAAPTWRLLSRAAPARAHLTATVPAGRAVVVTTRVRVAGARIAGGRRALISIGSPRRSRLQVGVARTPRGGTRWAGWRQSASGVARVAVSAVRVRRGRLQRLSVSASGASVVVRVDGRLVFRGGRAQMRSVSRRHITLGLAPGPGRGNILVSRPTARVVAPAVKLISKGPAPVVHAPGPDAGLAPAPLGPTALSPSASDRPYDPSFAFNQAIPAGAAADARSSAIVSQVDANTAASKVVMTSSSDVPPVYIAKPTDPFYSVNVGGQTTRFRVPAGAVPGGGSDTPMVILDPSHPDFGADTELRLWQASISGSSLQASGAGLFHYNSDGAILNPSGTRSLGTPFRGQGTGSGLSIMAGLIRPEEVRRGQIDHALRFAYSAADFSNRFRAPAIKTDQPNGTSTRNPATAMDMGMRLQLDPSVNCQARTVPGKADGSLETRYLRMLCTALQRYGMIAVDGTGDRGLMLMMEHDKTAPWASVVGTPLYGSYGYLIRDADSPSDGLSRNGTSGIPWNALRVLDRSTF